MRGENSIKTIEFQYNRYKGNAIIALIMGSSWILGIMLWSYLCNHVLGLSTDGSSSPYWQQHKELGFAITVLTPIIWIVVSIYPAIKIGQLLMEAKGKVEIYEDYAMLYVKGKELHIDEKATQLRKVKVSSRKIHPILYAYTLYFDNKKCVLTESYREGANKTTLRQRWGGERVKLSLTEAMSAIEPFVTVRQNKERERIIYIGNIAILLGDTLPCVFDDSPYYVEYSNLHCAEDVPLVSCLVRERANPIQVVGDIGFYDDPQHKSALSEAILRTLPIVDGVALNERIESEYVM